MNTFNKFLTMFGINKLTFGALFFILAVYLVGIPLVYQGQGYVLNVMINSSILSLASLGVWITFSIGRINISQGAFCLIGGYATAILMKDFGLSFWLAILLGGIISTIAGILIGLPVLRLKGVYFAMISLSLTEVARLFMLSADSITGGASGIIDIPRPNGLNLFGLQIIPDFGNSNLMFYYLSALLLILSSLSVWRLYYCRIGIIFRSLRQNEELATSLGINVARYRVMAFSFCCFLGGIAGGFFATFHQNIYPSTYTVNDSVFFMLYCFLGGLDFVFGPIVGAFLLTLGFEYLHVLQEYQSIIYAVLMIVLMLFMPNGVMSILKLKKKS